MKDAGLLWCWIMLGMLICATAYNAIYKAGKNNGYWLGRADGWKVAMRQRDNADLN
jgi:hypothetical protein